MKTGLFFGSFDPIHIGHIAIAKYMAENCEIQQLWFVVSPQNPLKGSETLLLDHHRLEMVKIAIEGDSRFMACDIEFSLPKPSYTINTLAALREKYPTRKFIIIMGSDNFVRLKEWKEYEKLIGEYSFLVYPRPGLDLTGLDFNCDFALVDSPLMEISSTMIRKAISEDQDMRNLLHPKVFNYIREMNFYKRPSF